MQLQIVPTVSVSPKQKRLGAERQAFVFTGGPSGIRTLDQEIKSLLLYQLS